MHSLDELILSVSRMAEEDRPRSEDLDLLFYCPCPVKLAIKERIEAIAAASAAAGDPLSVVIPMGCTSVDPFDPLHRETDPDRLPGIIASIGFGDFFRRGFVERFVDAGLFEAVLPETVTPLHRDAGLLDPRGCYTVYGLTPYIFLVDAQALGDAAPPECWADLLDPRFRGQINMCGDGDDMADAVLLLLLKEFVWEGVQRFAANTRGLLHSSRMALSGGPAKAGAVSILPYFFAETTRQPAHMRVIWPRDGAAASPLYVLAKKSARPRLDPLLRFFTRGFGEIESARWFLPLGGPLPPNLPGHARIKWVGWDYIRDNDITGLRDALNIRFREMVRGAACGS